MHDVYKYWSDFWVRKEESEYFFKEKYWFLSTQTYQVTKISRTKDQHFQKLVQIVDIINIQRAHTNQKKSAKGTEDINR